MRLRFTIRDLLWLMLVLALALGWWLDHKRLESVNQMWRVISPTELSS
jgi:hypothetical protein